MSRHGLFEETSYLLQKFPNIASLLTLFILFYVDKKKFIGLMLLINLIIVLMYGERGIVITTLLIIFLYYLRVGLLSKKLFLIYIGVLILLIMALGAGRNYIFNIETTSEQISFTEKIEGMTTEEVVMTSLQAFNIEMIDNFLVVYQDNNDLEEFHLGYDYLLGVVGLMPRFLWEDKPKEIMIGGWFRSKYIPDSGGRPITSLGDYWLNFWWIGVFFIMYFTGLLMRIVSDLSSHVSSYPLFLVFFFYLSAYGIVSQNLFFNFIFYGVPIATLVLLSFRLRSYKIEFNK